MADEKLQKFKYHGPSVYVPVIDRNVEDGDVIEGPPSLASNVGFAEVTSAKKGGDD